MKATLCVFVALVAVTSAAPAFMRRNPAACTAGAWCGGTACTCTNAGDCSSSANQYCKAGANAQAAKILSVACAHTDGTTALTADCTCGATTVTHIGTATAAANPAVAAAFFSPAPSPTAPGYCYLSKAAASDTNSNTRASVGTCAKRASVEGVTSNEVSTCTTFDSLNGCAAGKVCFNTGGKNSCALAACVKADNSAGTDGSAAVNGDCGCGDNNAFAANGKFCKVVNSFGFVSDTKKCNHEDGTTAVAGPCTCGTTTAVQVADQKWCKVVTGVGYMSTTLGCSNTDGSANVKAGPCTCGTSTAVQVANGKVCSVTTAGVGTEKDALCTATNGAAAVSGAACSCGTAGTGTTNVAAAVGKVCRVLANAIGTTPAGAGFVSDTVKCDNTDGTATPGTTPCTCGTTTQVQVANGKFCREATNGVGYQFDKKTCSNLVGSAAVTQGTGGACTCGTTTTAEVADNKFCYEDAAGKGWGSDTKQCNNFQSDANDAATAEGNGNNVAGQACSCGTLAATKGCDYCYRPTTTSVGYLGKATWAACANTQGTAPHLKGPQKCKCGTSAVVATGEYCDQAANGGAGAVLPACTNNDGTVVAAAKCACIKAATTSTVAVATVAAVGELCNAGTAGAVQACANDGTTSAKLGANAAPCTCGGSTCTAGQICRSTATTKCAAFSPTAAPTAAPTFGAVTIVQKLTMSGAQTEYDGNVKSLAEEAYGKALAIFDTAANPPAYKTGCSVTSVASAARRAYAVTFTATTSASTGAAANTAATALTPTSYATPRHRVRCLYRDHLHHGHGCRRARRLPGSPVGAAFREVSFTLTDPRVGISEDTTIWDLAPLAWHTVRPLSSIKDGSGCRVSSCTFCRRLLAVARALQPERARAV